MGMMGGNSQISAQATAGARIDPRIIQSAKRMMAMLQAAKNPQMALMQAAKQNPQLNAVMQMIGGRNPRDVFVEECKKHEVDPNEIINQLRN